MNRSRHNQSYKPVLEQSEAVGHAVNCATLMVSLADVGVLTGLRGYFDAAQRMWTDAVTRKMYVTGGVGTTGNEGFGEAYALPNISAYSETCAVLMFMTLNHRLFLATGDSKYIDVMERGMYNNAHRRRLDDGQSFLLRESPRERGRWPRHALGASVAGMLPTQPGAFPGLDAGLHLRAGQARRDVRQPLRVEPRRPSRSPASDCRSPSTARCRGAANRRSPFRPEAADARAPQVARSRLGAKPAGAGHRSTPTLDRSDKRTTLAVNGRATPATPDRLGYVTLDRVWNARRHRSDRVSHRSAKSGRRLASQGGPRPHGDRARTHRLLRRVARLRRRQRARSLARSTRRRLTPAVERVGGTSVVVLNTTARSVSNPRAAAKPVRLIPYHLWANRGAGRDERSGSPHASMRPVMSVPRAA